MTTFDAFVSHSSKNRDLAERIQADLEPEFQVWLDTSEIRLGSLLRNELQQAIGNSRVVILLWSEPAAASRWVAAETVTAFHLDRFIVPCVVDAASLPQFLGSVVYVDLARDATGGLDLLRRAVTNAPNAANEVPPLMTSQSVELQQAIAWIAGGQDQILALIGQRNVDEARRAQRRLSDAMGRTAKAWPYDTAVINLQGYHYKNEYLIEHFDEIQAGRPPRDELLERAERCFFDVLFVDPCDLSAVNGLGSVLTLERELDAAEFFVRKAIDLAEAAGFDYSAALTDLELIQRFKPTGP